MKETRILLRSLDAIYDSISNKKSHNHCIVASKNLKHRKIYTQSICASKEANTRNCTYIPASLYYQINKDFKLATPHARFLPQKELKEEFRDFCIQSLNDKKDLFINDDIEPSVILSTLHHNNSCLCKRCKSAIDKKYLFAIRETRYGDKERLCPFCLPRYYRYYKCEKCGAYGTTDKHRDHLKFYPEIGVALSDDEKETYNGVSVSSLQKLGIAHKVKIADNGMKYIVLYPTQQQLNTPEMTVVIGDKKILSTLKKYFGHTLCEKCEHLIGKDIGDNLIISGLYFNYYFQDAYPVECVEYIDVHSIQREVCDSLIAEIESNPELIYPLLMQPKGFFSAKAILKSIADTIVIKFTTDKDSDEVINEVTTSGKKAEAIIIIPTDLLRDNRFEKIQSTLDGIINHVCQKVECNINRDISFEDENLMITIDVSK